MQRAVALCALMACGQGFEPSEAEAAAQQGAIFNDPGDLPPETFEPEPVDQTQDPGTPGEGHLYNECELMRDLCNGTGQPQATCESLWFRCAKIKSKGPPDVPGWP